MSILFALFPGHQHEKAESQGISLQPGALWSDLLEPYSGTEKAVFLDSLMAGGQDGYPAIWRRFIRVGSSLPEQVANLFELCFEKEYQTVVFADTICAALPPERLKLFFDSVQEKDIVILPATDGSVLMLSMQLHLYASWDYFRFYEPAAIVEILSECHEKEITYAVMETLDPASAEKTVKEILLKKPSRSRN
jgi:hypothetical protein